MTQENALATSKQTADCIKRNVTAAWCGISRHDAPAIKQLIDRTMREAETIITQRLVSAGGSLAPEIGEDLTVT